MSDVGYYVMADKIELKKSNISGKGIRIVFRNHYKYQGDVENGEFHGHGIYTHKNGNKISGHWEHGKLNGRAIVTYLMGYEVLSCEQISRNFWLSDCDKIPVICQSKIHWTDGEPDDEDVILPNDGSIRL